MHRYVFLIAGLIYCLPFYSIAQSTTEDSAFIFPVSHGYVNDYENILDDGEEALLEKTVQQHEAETTNEIAVVTIESWAPYATLKEYTVALANDWGVGKKEKNNGITIVFSAHNRQIFIATGYGMETVLTDEEIQVILNKTMVPYLKKEQYFKAMKKGLDKIMKEIS